MLQNISELCILVDVAEYIGVMYTIVDVAEYIGVMLKKYEYFLI